MASPNLVVAGNLGLLVALTFVTYEVLLLPLFEHTRENLTIAAARRRIATGLPVTIGPDGPVPRAFGLSDGVARPSTFAVLPRLLKTTFKIALIVSLSIWESQLRSVQRASPVSVLFGTNGESSSIMAPLPVEGLRPGTVHSLVEFGKVAGHATRSYTVASTPGIDLEYPAQCVRTDGIGESRKRTVFYGIHSPNGAGRPSLVCLNGTEGRQRAPIFTYRPDGMSTVHANVSFVRLNELIAHDNVSALYAAVVVIGGEGQLAGRHTGFVGVTFQTHIAKDVAWSMYGLVLHRTLGTVLRVSIPLSLRGLLCHAGNAVQDGAVPYDRTEPIWPGIWRRNGENMTCPDGERLEYFNPPSGPLQHVSDVQDVGLQFETSDLFKIGQPQDILRAWLAETPWYLFRSNKLFTTDLRNIIEGDIFFFSTAKVPALTLNVGRTRSHVEMAKWSSALLFAVISAVLVYCVTSCVVEAMSRSTTGIMSECITREAVMSFLRDEGVIRGNKSDGASSRLTIGLANIGLHEQRVGLVPKGYCVVRDKRKLMSNGDLEMGEPG